MAENTNSLDQSTFKKLRRLYIIALSCIAFSLIVSQILIRKYLHNQDNDSRVINLAGRQRMLSQKLTKEILLISIGDNAQSKPETREQLSQTLQLWKSSHLALQQGNDRLELPGDNSEVISKMFEEVNPYFNKIADATNAILRKSALEQAPVNSIEEEVNIVRANEPYFLQLMDAIVNQYDLEAKQKVNRLRNLELLIMCLTLLILLGEFLLIFWPTAKAVKNSIHQLLEAENSAVKMAKAADELSEAKEKSVKELRALSQAIDHTLLFARIAPNGTIVHMGDKFVKLFKVRSFGMNLNLAEVLSNSPKEQIHIDKLISEHKKTGWQGEVKATAPDDSEIWLEMSIVPFNLSDDKSELLIICVDITQRHEALTQINKLTTASFEEKMYQQKLVSRQIIENQENEQNRIAKDIHDGIGQMLTGLKFNLESIDLSDTEKAASKIENLKELSLKIIEGVRTATFNLTPPELSDHGIVPALTKLTHELSKLTGKNIVLFNKTDFNMRMDSLVEINVYRITQEAINNAIKYADSSDIIVTLSHSKTILSLTIDDNGKGFNPDKLKAKRNGDGGMGMTFMRERIKYINGRLFMNSSPDNGTRITLNIPLD